MTTRARAQTAALAVTLALALAGCAGAPSADPVVTRLPTERAAPSAEASPSASAEPLVTFSPRPTVAAPTAPAEAPRAPGAGDCGGAPVTVAGASQTFVITGDCPELTVEGNAVTVDARAAVVGAVTVSGDRIRIDAEAIDSLTLQGNDDVVDTRSLRSLVIRGDRHVVTATESIASVLVAGNDNTVRGTGGAVDDQGQRNSLG